MEVVFDLVGLLVFDVVVVGCFDGSGEPCSSVDGEGRGWNIL